VKRLLIAALCGLSLAGAHAAPPADAREATADLYVRMSANDLSGVARYLPAGGFTELSPDAPAPHRLDAAAFAGLFGSGVHIDLHAADLQQQTLGDAAIVTGVRIGSITPPGAKPVETAAPFTMIWAHSDGQWQLRHVHLSAPVPTAR
jgi:ketosteroid isomerase-like protein